MHQLCISIHMRKKKNKRKEKEKKRKNKNKCILVMLNGINIVNSRQGRVAVTRFCQFWRMGWNPVRQNHFSI